MRFVSIVIERPSFLNIEMISFFILSSTRPILLLTVARPSSLYRPKFSFSNNGDKFSSRYVPTISQISVPSKLPIVKSNDGFSPLLTQVPSLLNNSHFRASLIASITLSSIVIMVLAQLIVPLRRSSEIDGQKFAMSNLINLRFSLCVRFLNQLITFGVFLCCFVRIFPANVEMMLLKYTLLILPTSLCDRFMSLNLGLFLNLSLWSLSVINACWSE